MEDFAYVDAIDLGVPGFSSLVEQSQTPGESWLDTAQKLLNTALMTYQQKQFISINMDRARQGLPPLDASQYGTGVQVGLSNDVKQLLVLGALGLGAVLYFATRRR